MGSAGLFSETISILEKNLDLRSLRHNMIISNIANKDTPHYKAFDLAVGEEMQKLTGTQGGNMALIKTHERHLPANENSQDYSEVSLTSGSNGVEQGADGNTVDVGKEMTKLAENNLLYETMAQIIRNKFQDLKIAIQGGGR